MTRTFLLEAQLIWVSWQDQKSKWLVAACDPMGLTVSAADYPALTEKMNLVVQEVLSDLLESGELRNFLVKKGWLLLELRDGQQIQPTSLPRSAKGVRFQVAEQFLKPMNRMKALEAIG